MLSTISEHVRQGEVAVRCRLLWVEAISAGAVIIVVIIVVEAWTRFVVPLSMAVSPVEITIAPPIVITLTARVLERRSS